MATTEGNRKIAAKLKEKYGVDRQGRSVWHARIGSKGGENSPGSYFKQLMLDDPDKLREISKAGGKAKAKQNEGKNENRDSPRPKAQDDAE